MTFKKLSEYFKLLEQNTSRLKITEILADLFKEAGEEEIDKICYLSLGRLLPAYEGLEFQMAGRMMERAVAKAVGVEKDKVAREYKKMGDLGEVGETLKQQSNKVTKQQSELFKEKMEIREIGVIEAYERLLEIARESGSGSVERKVDKMAALLEDLDALSCRFIVRMPLGKMRLGFSEMTIMDGLSWMMVGSKSLRGELEDAYNLVADIGEIAKTVRGVGPASPAKRGEGIREIRGIKPKLGTPVISALAQRLGTVEEMLEKVGEKNEGVALEPKYDGERLQLHFRSNKATKQQRKKEKNYSEALKLCSFDASFTRIFTRNLENVTQSFPDVAEAMKKEIKADEVILDSEGVGLDPKTGRFVSFQETIKRKRKHLVGETAKEIPIKCFVFDIMYKDGESLIKMPFWERRKILEKILPLSNKTLVLTPQVVTEDPVALRKFHEEQIKKGLEGVMVKKINAPYDPGRRGFTWVKFKQEETKKGGGLADTIDCVVMGISRGKGKRADFGVGAFLVGVKQGSKFVTLTKIGTGLTDEQFRELKVQSAKFKVKEKPEEYEVNKNIYPDSWCAPGLIVEIQADNITQSPIHTAGLALRFPRLVRFREDKPYDQITTVKEVEKLFALQFGAGKELKGVKGN